MSSNDLPSLLCNSGLPHSCRKDWTHVAGSGSEQVTTSCGTCLSMEGTTRPSMESLFICFLSSSFTPFLPSLSQVRDEMTCPVRIIKQISQLQDSTCSLDTPSFLRKGSILYLPLKTSPLHPRKRPIKFSDAFVFSSTRIKKSVFQANQANYKLMNAYVCAKRKAKGMIFTIKQNENQKV